MAIKHSFTSGVTDGNNSNLVRPSNWNADHTIEDGTTLTSPVLVTPELGTPDSGTLTNCDGLPAAGVVGTALVASHASVKSANAVLGHVIVESASYIDVDTDGKLTLGDHHALHENGGLQEISVSGLSGTLADDQHVLDAEVTPLITDANLTTTDVTTNDTSTTKHGLAPKAVAPGVGLINVLGIANAETAITNKALFDATVPSTQAIADVAATGSAVVSARRDHLHGMPSAATMDAASLAAAVQSGAITDGVTKAPTHDAVFDVKVTAEAAQTAAEVAAVLPNRNAIINGGMDIWQRGTATLTNPAAGTYFPDRFKCEYSMGDGTFNLLASAETPAVGFPFQYSLKLDCTHIETAVAAGEVAALSYSIEGYDFKRFEGEVATLSFWVKAVKAGIYCAALQNSASNQAYVHEFTVNSASTWEKKTVTLTFNSGGTFLYTTGIGVKILWTVMCGTNRQIATANKDTWQAGDYWATDAQVNGLDNTDNNFWITGVQLELGSVATPFEYRRYQQELALCQRYCLYLYSAGGNKRFLLGSCDSTSTGVGFMNYPIPMRTIPTQVASAVGNFVFAGSQLTVFNVGYSTSVLYAPYMAGTGTPYTVGYSGGLIDSNIGATFILLDAEL